MKDNTSHGRAAKRARIRLGRHDQGRDRIALNALTIKVHRDAIQALLRGEDVDDWRLVRFQLGKPQADDPPQDGGVRFPEDDPYEVDPDLA